MEPLRSILFGYQTKNRVALIKVIMVAFGYCVKYDKAWQIKQLALKLIYGDCAEAYEHLPAMVYIMRAKNSGMYFEYVLKPEVIRSEGRQYFLRAF
jgi:hypothetical protein